MTTPRCRRNATPVTRRVANAPAVCSDASVSPAGHSDRGISTPAQTAGPGNAGLQRPHQRCRRWPSPPLRAGISTLAAAISTAGGAR